jgi:hypothetical protein
MTETTDKITTFNKSRTYLMPLLSKDIDIEFEYLIKNTYIKFDRDIGCIEQPIAILFENENTEAFKEYHDYLLNHKLFFDQYLFTSNDDILFIFRFPDRYKEEYKLFKEGKYSKFSKEAKGLIISYSAEAYVYPPLVEDLMGVLWKQKSRKKKLEDSLGMSISDDSELASKVQFDTETFIL